MQTPQTDMTETLITLTSDIVAAHVSNNSVSVDDVPSLIKQVHEALAGLGQADEAQESRPDPAVSVRASVRKNAITCLDCGRKMKMLKRHLMTEHDMTPEEYRARWNLPSDYPLVAPAYAETRRTLAKKIGLGRKPGQKVARKADPKPKAPAKTAAGSGRTTAAKSATRALKKASASKPAAKK